MRKIIISVLAILLATTAHAESEPTCTPDGSARCTALLWKEQHEYFRALLARKHDELTELVRNSDPQEGGELAHRLEEQQNAWLKYYDEECKLTGALSGASGGWRSVQVLRCMAYQTDRRYRRSVWAIRCINSIPREKRLFEQNKCLYQLTPLSISE